MSRTTIRMRVLPRFPARISGTNGIVTVRESADLIVKNDFSDLIRIPAVDDGTKIFILTWNSDTDSYSIMSFTDTFSAAIDQTGLMASTVYDPQGKATDAFARANQTGVQAISTITNLQSSLDTLTAAAAAANASIVPPGAILYFSATTAPTGWLKANGALVSRTTYAALWARVNTEAVSEAVWASGFYARFSVGDGSTTFRVPDLRGLFFRAWDDGRGVDTGRGLGTFEADQNRSHTHIANAVPDHVHGFGSGNRVPLDAAGTTFSQSGAANTGATTQTTAAGGHTPVINADGGNEARPQNLALLACVKY